MMQEIRSGLTLKRENNQYRVGVNEYALDGWMDGWMDGWIEGCMNEAGEATSFPALIARMEKEKRKVVEGQCLV